MNTERAKRIAAALALTTSITLLGGMTAQADTTSLASKTESDVANNAPTGVIDERGPFPSKWYCLIKSHGKRCYVKSEGWYFTP